jgi:hypothetical protein
MSLSESHTTTCPLERRQDALEGEELHIQSRAHDQARFGVAVERHPGIATLTAQNRTDRTQFLRPPLPPPAAGNHKALFSSIFCLTHGPGINAQRGCDNDVVFHDSDTLTTADLYPVPKACVHRTLG